MAIRATICVASLVLFLTLVEARIPGVYTGGAWQSAHATFYGGSDASGTMGTVILNYSC
jgi:hypothetical protein